jgi:light-regulated signal transduction histidine kinase (bacteriophytochrome)
MIFQRLHSREAYEGTGIGLALARKIVEYHDGEIWLDPDYSGGACFRFTFPIIEETQQ